MLLFFSLFFFFPPPILSSTDSSPFFLLTLMSAPSIHRKRFMRIVAKRPVAVAVSLLLFLSLFIIVVRVVLVFDTIDSLSSRVDARMRERHLHRWLQNETDFIIITSPTGKLEGKERDDEEVLASVVVVSCNKHERDQSYWSVIASTVEHLSGRTLTGFAGGPPPYRRGGGGCASALVEEEGVVKKRRPANALVWLGDAVYADAATKKFLRSTNPLSVEQMGAKFVAQRHAPFYSAFVESCVDGVTGVWDDHDMGKNDGGGEYEHKDAMQRYYLDFLDAPQEDPRRRQGGVFTFFTVPFPYVRRVAGKENNENDVDGGGKTTQEEKEEEERSNRDRFPYQYAMCFLLLDVRYSRTAVNATRSGDMLGEDQWEWIEERLRSYTHFRSSRNKNKSKNSNTRDLCALTLIGGGVQFSLDSKITESWESFPHSRDRLLALLRAYRIERTVFLTGDVHYGETGADFSRNALDALGYPLVEVTSSGLTHTAADLPLVSKLFRVAFPSTRRIGAYLDRNFGIVRLLARKPKGRCNGGEGTKTLGDDDDDGGGTKGEGGEGNCSEDDLSVSITIHGFPPTPSNAPHAGGELGPVQLALTIPLNDLTYRHACTQFALQEKEKEKDGEKTAPVPWFCSIASKEGTRAVLPAVLVGADPSTTHYMSEPRPILTATVVFLQRYFFTTKSMLGVVALCKSIVIGLVLALGLLVCLALLLSRVSRSRQSSRRFTPRPHGSDNPNGEKTKEA